MVGKIKNFLKKIPLIYSFNATLKARKNSLKFKVLYRHYQRKAKVLGVTYNEQNIPQEVHAKLAERGIRVKPVTPGKLRIFWVGAHEAQDKSGFLQGLESFGEVVTFTNIQGKYGLASKHDFSRHTSFSQVIKSNSRTLLEQVEAAHKKNPLHILMGQMWGDSVDVDALVKIQQMGIPAINVSMDDKLPALWGEHKGRRIGSVGLCKGLDLVLTTSPDTCLWYAIEGCPAIFWPLASDPKIFYPRSEKIYNVVFVGGKYGLRGKIVKKIISAGVSVEAFGPGWPNGFIDAPKIAEVFGKAKIILGTGNVGYNKNILTIKLRDFDATMSGALYITHRNPDLLKLFEEGKEIECYDSIEECIRKIKLYLANPKKLKVVAAAGLAKARECHTWKKRIHETLELIGLL